MKRTLIFKVGQIQALAISNYLSDEKTKSLYPAMEMTLSPVKNTQNLFNLSIHIQNGGDTIGFLKDIFDLAFYAGRESVFCEN